MNDRVIGRLPKLRAKVVWKMDQTWVRKKKKSWEYEEELLGKDLDIMELTRLEEEEK